MNSSFIAANSSCHAGRRTFKIAITMKFVLFHPDDAPVLLKQSLAAKLGRAILEGRIKPGERIVEGTWARELGVAQTSIREAINILVSQGFVQKGHGRSARVIKLSEQEVVQIYHVEAALESTAARLVTERNADLTELRKALQSIRDALQTRNLGPIIEAVLRFHITLCETSENSYIIEQYKRLAIPLYAFTLIRAIAKGVGPEPWLNSVPIFERMVEALGSGDPLFAEQFLLFAIRRFSRQALEIWARDPASKNGAAD
jgi:DNA-binding GntR family transcriptional regulator